MYVYPYDFFDVVYGIQVAVLSAIKVPATQVTMGGHIDPI